MTEKQDEPKGSYREVFAVTAFYVAGFFCGWAAFAVIKPLLHYVF